MIYVSVISSVIYALAMKNIIGILSALLMLIIPQLLQSPSESDYILRGSENGICCFFRNGNKMMLPLENIARIDMMAVRKFNSYIVYAQFIVKRGGYVLTMNKKSRVELDVLFKKERVVTLRPFIVTPWSYRKLRNYLYAKLPAAV